MIHKTADLFGWSQARLNISTNTIYNRDGFWKLHWSKLFNSVMCSPKPGPKVVKNFKPILSNPIQIWSNRNYKIQFHQDTRMRQNLNPRPCQWLMVAILVGCSPGLEPAQNCEGSPAVVVIVYTTSHSNTWTDWQLIIIIKPRTARTLERRQHGTQTRINWFHFS